MGNSASRQQNQTRHYEAMSEDTMHLGSRYCFPFVSSPPKEERSFHDDSSSMVSVDLNEKEKQDDNDDDIDDLHLGSRYCFPFVSSPPAEVAESNDNDNDGFSIANDSEATNKQAEDKDLSCAVEKPSHHHCFPFLSSPPSSVNSPANKEEQEEEGGDTDDDDDSETVPLPSDENRHYHVFPFLCSPPCSTKKEHKEDSNMAMEVQEEASRVDKDGADDASGFVTAPSQEDMTNIYDTSLQMDDASASCKIGTPVSLQAKATELAATEQPHKEVYSPVFPEEDFMMDDDSDSTEEDAHDWGGTTTESHEEVYPPNHPEEEFLRNDDDEDAVEEVASPRLCSMLELFDKKPKIQTVEDTQTAHPRMYNEQMDVDVPTKNLSPTFSAEKQPKRAWNEEYLRGHKANELDDACTTMDFDNSPAEDHDDDDDDEVEEKEELGALKEVREQRGESIGNNKENVAGSAEQPTKKITCLLDEYPECLSIAKQLGHPKIIPRSFNHGNKNNY